MNKYGMICQDFPIPGASLSVLTEAAEIHQLWNTVSAQKDTILHLGNELHQKESEIQRLKEEVNVKDKAVFELKAELDKRAKFGTASVVSHENKFKNLFKYNTGIIYVRFLGLLTFLTQTEAISYEKGRRDIKTVSSEDALFLTLCRLQHNFGLKDLALRFGLSLQSTGIVFNTWIDRMYLKLSQLSIWPHRDNIIAAMPTEFKQDFPTIMPKSMALNSRLRLHAH